MVGSLGTVVQMPGNFILSLLAVGLVAVMFAPLRSRLQRAVNHLLYGQRDEPYAVVSRLGQRLESTITPDAVLPSRRPHRAGGAEAALCRHRARVR